MSDVGAASLWRAGRGTTSLSSAPDVDASSPFITQPSKGYRLLAWILVTVSKLFSYALFNLPTLPTVDCVIAGFVGVVVLPSRSDLCS